MLGQFDFNATPLAPPGTKVVTHVKPGKRNTWELHGEKGFYVGLVIDHYRCVQCYFPRTRARRVCDIVAFLAHAVPFPEVTIKDHLQQAASDIISILTQPPSTTVPSLQAGDPTRIALLKIAEQLHRVENIPQPIKETPKQILDMVGPAHTGVDVIIPTPRAVNIIPDITIPRQPNMHQHSTFSLDEQLPRVP